MQSHSSAPAKYDGSWPPRLLLAAAMASCDAGHDVRGGLDGESWCCGACDVFAPGILDGTKLSRWCTLFAFACAERFLRPFLRGGLRESGIGSTVVVEVVVWLGGPNEERSLIGSTPGWSATLALTFLLACSRRCFASSVADSGLATGAG